MKQEDKKNEQEKILVRKRIKDEQKILSKIAKQLLLINADEEAQFIRKSVEYLNKAMRKL